MWQVIWALCFVVITVIGGQIFPGERPILTDEWAWVEVMNPDGVKNGNGIFAFGTTCGVKRGNHVEMILLEADRVLVRYIPHEQGYGTNCGIGTLYYMSEVQWRQLQTRQQEYQRQLQTRQQEYQRQEERREQEKQRLREILPR